VVLRVDRHAVLTRNLRDPVRDRPGDGHAVPLQAQVPVQARGAVLLYDESISGGGVVTARARLRGCAEVALAPVVG
jgi:hypothetical protein